MPTAFSTARRVPSLWCLPRAGTPWTPGATEPSPYPARSWRPLGEDGGTREKR